MVCIPCIVIPFFLFIWYRFIQPLVLKFWNPWAKVESAPPPAASGGSCPRQSLNTTVNSEKVRNGSNEVSTGQEEGKKEQ